MREKNSLLQVENLSIEFSNNNQWRKAVKNISFCVGNSEVVGIIGESGCGKSITAFSLLKLLPQKKAQWQGKVKFQGQRIDNLPIQEYYKIRGKKMGMIFQDPLSHLNPVLSIQQQLLEMRGKKDRKEVMEKILYLLSQVGFTDHQRILQSYPHQLSGGMRQRVMIVMALLFEPNLLIADEPTTALDVTVQAQILYLLKKLQQEKKMSLLLITHDLGVIAQTCDFVYVMYFGEIIEQGNVSEIFSHPKHPYTKALINMLKLQKNISFIKGKVPSIEETFLGCPFAPRCSRVQKKCYQQPAILQQMPQKNGIEKHLVACHYPYNS